MKQLRESLHSSGVFRDSRRDMDEGIRAEKVAYNGIKNSFSKVEWWRHLQFLVSFSSLT